MDGLSGIISNNTTKDLGNNIGQAILDFGEKAVDKGKDFVKNKVIEPVKKNIVEPVKEYGEVVRDTVDDVKNYGLGGAFVKEAKEGNYGEGTKKVVEKLDNIGNLNGLATGMGKEETPEEKAKREESTKRHESTQSKNIDSLKKETDKIESDSVKESLSSEQERVKSVEDLLKSYVNDRFDSPIYNELPKTVRQAYKAGRFGSPMKEEVRKAYLEEHSKPIEKRIDKELRDAFVLSQSPKFDKLSDEEKQKVAEKVSAYENKKAELETKRAEIDAEYAKEKERTKDARQARDWYILDAIGTGMRNVGNTLRGGSGDEQSAWNKLQGSRMEGAQKRYNELLNAKADAVIEAAKHKQGFDQKNQEAFRDLYNNKRLQPLLNQIDVDTQVQLIDLMKDKADAINFDSFINALAIQLASDPKGTVSSFLNAGKDLYNVTK